MAVVRIKILRTSWFVSVRIFIFKGRNTPRQRQLSRQFDPTMAGSTVAVQGRRIKGCTSKHATVES